MNTNHMNLLKRSGACPEALEYASKYDSIPAAIVACDRVDWLQWGLRLIADKRKRVGTAAYIVRNTPGVKFTDERSVRALDVCDAYARGEATDEDLRAAYAAAADAADAAYAAAYAAADAAADAARAAADAYAADAARAAAYAAYAAAYAAYAAADAAARAAYTVYAAADAAADAARAAAYAAYAAAYAAADAARSAYTVYAYAAARAAADAATQWQSDYIKSLDWNTLTGGEA